MNNLSLSVFMPVIISFLISVVFCPILIPFLRKLKFGQTEREEGPQSHLKKNGTPTMVLSGSVAWGVLPGWMYHAQVGPRSNFVFDGSIYGITWVDLVFPFFLFAMGAAFPFSIGNKYRKGSSRRRIIYDSLLRGFRLTFFAIFIQHIYPWVVSSPQDVRS